MDVPPEAIYDQMVSESFYTGGVLTKKVAGKNSPRPLEGRVTCILCGKPTVSRLGLHRACFVNQPGEAQ